MKIGNDIYYVGVNDHRVDLFEGQYVVPNGMSYNSYVIKDEKIAVMDTVDAGFTEEWLGKVAEVLDGAKPDYLVVQHMEPDHAANIENFMKAYPDTTVVANTKTFTMMENFFRGMDLEGKKHIVANGDTLTLGKHVLTFVFAYEMCGRDWSSDVCSSDLSTSLLYWNRRKIRSAGTEASQGSSNS